MVNEGMTDKQLDGEMRKEVFAEVTWNRQATDEDEWRALGEVSVLQWTLKGY